MSVVRAVERRMLQEATRSRWGIGRTRRPSGRRVVLLALLACAGVLALGVGSAQAQSPAIDFEFPSTVGQTTAEVDAGINPFGIDTTCQVQLVDDTTFQATGYTGVTPQDCTPADLGDGNGDANASFQASGLTLNTTYHFRFLATNADGTATGADTTFMTLGASTIDFEFPSNVGQTSAELDAGINPLGNDTTCQVQIVEDTIFQATGYTGVIPQDCAPADLGDGNDDVSASFQASGLTLNTTYHFRFIATNSLGTVTGGDTTFTTLGASTIDSESTSNVTQQTAELDTQVNPLGTETTCDFQYIDDATFQASGYTTATTVPCNPPDLGSGVGDVAANAQIGGLTTGTTYHFRVVATNALGTVNGPDSTFQTLPPLAVDSESAANVTDTTATLKAQINPEGVDTHYQFQYVDDATFQASGFNNATTVPTNPVDIGSGTTDTGAGIDLSGLHPNTTYHFRVVGTSSFGTVNGDARTFKTAAGAAPVGLPDNRAYEMVSPVNKADGEVTGSELVAGDQAAPSGNAMGFFSFTSFPGSAGPGLQYIATRGATGWTTATMLPPQAPGQSLEAPGYGLYATDLSKAVLANGDPAVGGGLDDPPLVPGEPRGPLNLFVRTNATNTFQLVNLTPVGVTPVDATLDNGSADLSHVVFHETAALTPGASATVSNLFDWNNGRVSLIAVGGKLGGVAQFGSARIFNAVSSDGSVVFYTDALGNLNMFKNGVSTQIDRPQGGSGLGGGGSYQIADTPGSVVYFTDGDPAGLTSDTTPGSGANLYAYNTGTNELTDVTRNQASAIVDGVVGTSSDGSWVYFVAEGALATGATAGQENLYVVHNLGTPTFIAALNGNDSSDWGGQYTARVTPDGTKLAFDSTNSLTGYDNTDSKTQSPDTEVFLYNATANSLVCASCNPTGVRPIGSSTVDPIQGGLLSGGNTYLSRSLSNDGSRLFFDSSDALTPRDNNAAQDVYEWENGQTRLISTGTDSDKSVFVDASSDGNDVFFLTRQQLVPQDGDGGFDLYDARVNGGFPVPASTSPCSGDGCRPGAASAPPSPSQGTSTFSGPGNPKPPAAPKPKKASVKVSVKRLSDFRFAITLRPSSDGRITISGAGLKTLKKAVKAGHSYKLTVNLTQAERNILHRAHKRKLRVKVHVAFKATQGTATSKTMTVTVKA